MASELSRASPGPGTELVLTATTPATPGPRPLEWYEEPWLSTCQSVGGSATENAVEVEGAAFGYKRQVATGLEEVCVLDQVSFQVQKGSFVMIAGPVGSGKSTLLTSLACLRAPLRGQCRVNGHRAFVSQKPFLLNGTVKENILFGLPLDEGRYASALHMAALSEDLSTLSSGDATPVGESGVPHLEFPSLVLRLTSNRLWAPVVPVDARSPRSSRRARSRSPLRARSVPVGAHYTLARRSRNVPIGRCARVAFATPVSTRLGLEAFKTNDLHDGHYCILKT